TMKILVQETALFTLRNLSQPQTPELPHQPSIKRKSKQTVLDQQFQVRVMGEQNLLVVSANVPGQLGWHAMKAPSRERTFPKHLPAAGVDSLPEIDWPLLFPAVAHGRGELMRSGECGNSKKRRACGSDQCQNAEPPIPRHEQQGDDSPAECQPDRSR